MRDENGILESPLGPGLLETCPRCRKRWALVLVRRDPDDGHGRISVYRCRYCGETAEFAASNPVESV